MTEETAELIEATRIRVDERRRRSMPRWVLWTILAAAYLAIMVPLGFILHFALESDARAERAGRTACELARSNAQLADTLDAGLALLVIRDGPERDLARERLAEVTREGHRASISELENCES